MGDGFGRCEFACLMLVFFALLMQGVEVMMVGYKQFI